MIDLDRFWSKVDRSGGEDACWPWLAGKRHQGYGQYGFGNRADGTFKNYKAHRLAYELVCGPIPPGMHACHRCDRPDCVNPRHIFLGTNADNVADRIAKGRTRRGATHPYAKLTEPKVLEIVERVRLGETDTEIARTFGLNNTAIRDIRTGKNWAWLTGLRVPRPETEINRAEGSR